MLVVVVLLRVVGVWFVLLLCFFFIDTSTTDIYTLSLPDALPIFLVATSALPGFLIPSSPWPPVGVHRASS